MRILVVGGGGREHAIIRKLRENRMEHSLYCCPGNGGIAAEAECIPVLATDIDGIVRVAREIKAELVVVTPEDPLVLGMVDALQAAGIPAFGPNKKAAAIEGSKVFSKDLMRQYGIPTAGYRVFDEAAAALAYVSGVEQYPLVVKADGLALGKGVTVAKSREAAAAAIHEAMTDKVFGSGGSRIVIEEFLTGIEVSVLAFTDAKTIRPMVSSMDHKRIFDGDLGPNTGGMGTIAPNPCYTGAIAQRCMEEIFLPTMRAMNSEGRPFKGCLFFGLMLTADGPRVIEYNCRFGDPETQVVLPLLDGDLAEILLAVCEERLDEVTFSWKEQAAACVIAASGGYPKAYEKGKRISGLDDRGQVAGAVVYHAGTAKDTKGYLTAGGRVLGITCTGDTLEEALRASYQGIDAVSFDGMQYRRDIGVSVLEKK